MIKYSAVCLTTYVQTVRALPDSYRAFTLEYALELFSVTKSNIPEVVNNMQISSIIILS